MKQVTFALLALMLTANAMAQSPVLSCEDFEFEYGCKIDRGENGIYECDGEEIDIEWYEDFTLMRFESTVPIWFVGAKAATCYEEHHFDPPTLEAEDLIACENRKHSHDLFCWNDDPKPELGCCVIDGENYPDSTEAFCDEAGGIWTQGEECPEVVSTLPGGVTAFWVLLIALIIVVSLLVGVFHYSMRVR